MISRAKVGVASLGLGRETQSGEDLGEIFSAQEILLIRRVWQGGEV
ncbi:hypothetical protein [Propionivibrio sp.]|nr:hypothetical protein [Propionivibrio sp.]MBK8744585.1 hypothetical protein [Propionivibrio sp.]